MHGLLSQVPRIPLRESEPHTVVSESERRVLTVLAKTNTTFNSLLERRLNADTSLESPSRHTRPSLQKERTAFSPRRERSRARKLVGLVREGLVSLERPLSASANELGRFSKDAGLRVAGGAWSRRPQDRAGPTDQPVLLIILFFCSLSLTRPPRPLSLSLSLYLSLDRPSGSRTPA